MSFDQFMMPLVGGLLIGVSASLLLLLKGRVFGVSGILAGVLLPVKNDTAWRVGALAGLISAGVVLTFMLPEALDISSDGSMLRYIVAGLLVGFGTQLGSGCTSGHGVCGISRLSIRSLMATATFIGAGMITVFLMRMLEVMP
jgi:uncharacterized membrane protein YedE/YeeE